MTVAGGWYDGARRVGAHPGRIGGAIDPEVIVVHTTDCMPGSMPAIVKAWSSVAGNGACAHAIIGRTPIDGMVQMIPFNKNANHAGGYPGHGWYLANNAPPRAAGAPLVHPNTIAVGIELDCAGYLGRPRIDLPPRGFKAWTHPDTGRVIAASDVDVDADGRGWHKVTQYQYDTLGNLIDELRAGMRLPRPGLAIVPNGTYADNGVKWADVGARVSVVGHVTLDPLQKTDPGPFVMAWLAAHFV